MNGPNSPTPTPLITLLIHSRYSSPRERTGIANSRRGSAGGLGGSCTGTASSPASRAQAATTSSANLSGRVPPMPRSCPACGSRASSEPAIPPAAEAEAKAPNTPVRRDAGTSEVTRACSAAWYGPTEPPPAPAPRPKEPSAAVTKISAAAVPAVKAAAAIPVISGTATTNSLWPNRSASTPMSTACTAAASATTKKSTPSCTPE